MYEHFNVRRSVSRYFKNSQLGCKALQNVLPSITSEGRIILKQINYFHHTVNSFKRSFEVKFYKVYKLHNSFHLLSVSSNLSTKCALIHIAN